MNFGIDDLQDNLYQATSAKQVAEISEAMKKSQRLSEEAKRQTAQRDAKIIAGAEASIAQKELLEQQLETAQEQNTILNDNYNKLKELYEIQEKANKEAQIALIQSRRNNTCMMIIAIIAMLAAIAGPIVTILVSQ